MAVATKSVVRTVTASPGHYLADLARRDLVEERSLDFRRHRGEQLESGAKTRPGDQIPAAHDADHPAIRIDDWQCAELPSDHRLDRRTGRCVDRHRHDIGDQDILDLEIKAELLEAATAIRGDADLLDGHDAGARQLANVRQGSVEPGLAPSIQVRIIGRSSDRRRIAAVCMAVRAEASQPPHHGGAGCAFLSEVLEDGLIARAVANLVGLAQEDTGLGRRDSWAPSSFLHQTSRARTVPT